ncbi:hypothetical protein DFJ73DRAFT_665967 [Zopfochytrium polystomum]|nr:hypothetical protein DFJ73DRAFT_665967 [Zopfochytrium polystomum]
MAPKRRSALPVPPRTKSKDKERDVPATIPVVENIDGVEWFTIEYAVKKDKKVYRIRTDIDDISVETLPTDFKSDNCVYSKAFCPRSQYKGHRWNYENSVNIVGWKLCWKNSEICGQKGLIQRAVDCFRNRFPELRSRRVVRQEKKVNGVLRSRRIKSGSANAGTPYPRTERCLRSVKSVTPSEVDPDSDDDTDADFKRLNCVYPRAVGDFNHFKRSFPFAHLLMAARYATEVICNEIGWRLAYLNPRLVGRINLLQKALDAYRDKFGTGSALFDPPIF